MPFSESRSGKLLRIFIGDADRHQGRPLYEVIVEQARAHGLAGATVLHGLMGYGAHSRLHTASILRLSTDLPVIIEIVDLPERIDAFLPIVDTLIDDGLVTIEAAEVLIYRHKRDK
jgi:PII-like signaling protein